jgi:hypothetical protein
MSKLANDLAAIHEANFTAEEFNRLRVDKNAKRIFDILFRGWSYNNKEYSAKSREILDFVASNIKGFQADIAAKAKSIDAYEMTQKQIWCIAYAFINF